MPTPQTQTGNGEAPYGAIVVITGLVSVVAITIVAMFQYPSDATMVVTALGPVIGVIGTLAAYALARFELPWQLNRRIDGTVVPAGGNQ